jgi:LL-diaminopimelate aminotransferase
MLCGAPARVNEVLRFKSNMDSGMFLPIQLAAAKALTLGKDWYEQVNSVYRTRREKVFQLLDALNCKYSRKQAGLFVWAGIEERFRDCYDCADTVLYKSNVFITPGGIFGTEGNKYVRVSLCTTEENIDEAIRRIKNS